MFKKLEPRFSLQSPPKIDINNLLNQQSMLDKLSIAEKIKQASLLIKDCKAEEMSALLASLEKFDNKSPESFYAFVQQALEVKERIASFNDPGENEPPFTEDEKTRDLMNQYPELANYLLEEGDKLIASVCHLIHKLSSKELNNFSKTVNITFQNTPFAETVTEAIIMRQLLSILYSKEPALLFEHPDFKASLFPKYEVLVQLNLRNAEDVAKQFGKISDGDQLHNIEQRLQLLRNQAYKQTDVNGFFNNLYDNFWERNRMNLSEECNVLDEALESSSFRP